MKILRKNLYLGAFISLLTLNPSTGRADIPTTVKPVGVGLGSYSYYSSGPFANTMLTGGGWLEYSNDWGTSVSYYNPNGTPNPQFNAKGLPNYLNSGKKLRMLLWPYDVGAARGSTGVGKWVVTWQGNADIRLNGAMFIAGESSGSSTGNLLNGRRVYNMSASGSGGHVTVEAISTPVTDLKVWLPDPANPQNQSLEGSSSMWHPAFLSYLGSADFNNFRFMDWGDTNQSPVKAWADRRLPTMAIQNGVLNRRDPTEGVVAYTNSSGQPVYFSGNRQTGVAYEYMVELCNTMNKDMWICVPHLATNDFIDKLARLIRYGSDGVDPYTSTQANPVYPPLNSNLKVWVEYSNEIWSNGDNFPQGNWAQAQADTLGISRAQFNARRFSQIWSRFQTVFGGSSRIVRCAAIFTANSNYTTPFLTELKNYGATLSPAVKPDIVAPTTYFGNGIQDWAYDQANLAAGTSDQWFHTTDTFVYSPSTGATRPVSVPTSDPYWTSSKLAEQQQATFAEWKKRIFSGSSAAGGGPDATGTGGGFDSSLHDEIFTTFGQHLPIVSYEGGPSLYSDYLDSGDVRDDGITNFDIALNRRPEFAEIYRIQLNMARAKGLSSHSMFVDVGQWSKYGQWGHLEYTDQPLTESVKWTAVQDWAADIVTIRPIDQLVGTRPTFATAGTLPQGSYLSPYSQDIVTTGGNGTPTITVIGSQLLPGLVLSPVPGNPTRYRISGTPQDGGWSYFYLRVNDADGDASWQIYSLYVSGGPGTLVELDPRGTFSGASSLPWTQTYSLDPNVTWSGLNRGAAYSSSGGSATGSDGTGVNIFSDTDGIRFSVSQGALSQSSSTLASAITDNEYFKFTVTPQSGKPLNLRKAEFRLAWVREEYHSVRDFAVMTSIGGFAEAQRIFTLNTTPGQGAVTETVFTLPDTAAYSNRTTPVEFRVYFYGSQYAHKARILGLKLTRNTSADPGQFAISPATLAITEGNAGTTNATLTVNRVGGKQGAVSVSYATFNGTASAVSDYASTSGTLSWANGEVGTKTLIVPIYGDTTFEANETFNLTLSNPTGGSSIGSTSSTITITNDDVSVTPPTITTQPTSQTVTAGANVILSVVATNGGGSLSYQWKKGTTNVGTNSSTLSLPNVTTANAGSYTVVVSNSAGSMTSAAATLTVNQAPTGGYFTAVESSFAGTNPSSSSSWTATSTLHSSVVYGGWTKGAGIEARTGNNYLGFAQGFPANEVDSTLALARSDNEYWSTTIQAASGALDLRSAEIELKVQRLDYHAARNYAVFTNVGGFAVGQEVFDSGRFTSTSEQVFTFQLPNTSTYAGLTAAAEIRILPYGGQYSGHDSAITGFKLRLQEPIETWNSQDIGSPAVAGSSSYDVVTDSFTVSGSGNDIWGTSDNFHFVTLDGGMTGDGEIVVRVVSQTNTNPWAKAGIMIRDGLAAGAKSAQVLVTPSNGIRFQYRTTPGGSSGGLGVSGSAPEWLKLTRSGNNFTAYQSEDGLTWTQMGAPVPITMGSSVQVGLCVTSHFDTALSTVVIDNVTVTP